jgi:uncharacterized Zn finger protein
MPITKEWLRKAANAQSFSKGEGYYDDVEDVVKQGNSYTAIVLGSDEYEVTITDQTANTPLSSCSCPYAYDGICKHIVAVGLNIIAGNFEEEEVDEVAEAMTEQAVSLPTTTFYDDFFMTKEKSLRKSFLRQLFANDARLRQQFFAFSQPKIEAQPQTISAELIEKTANQINKKLTKLADLDADDFYSRGGGGYNDYYDDEGSDVAEWAEEKITDVFTPFATEVLQKIQNGAIIAATEMLIGLFEGCLGLEFHGDLEDYMGDDFESIALNKLSELIGTQKTVLQSAIFHENDIKTSILLILNRWAKRKDGLESIEFFENYFIAVSHQPPVAKWLIKEAQERKLSLDLIFLTLANATTIKDDVLWITSAESVAYTNSTIMQMLLDKYWALGRMNEFHKAAKAAVTNFEHSNFIPYLKTRVLEKYDSVLYVQIYLESATQTSSLEDFLVVRPLLSTQKEADFLEMCKKDKQNLYVDILNKDGDLANILQFLEPKKSATKSYGYFSYNFDMEKALSYIIEEYPDEVFNIVHAQTEEALAGMKLDRSGYARAVAHLRPLKNLPKGHQLNAINYNTTLRIRYGSRPAFLDELGKIGLYFK